jgi:hypothetical protein
MGDICWPDGKKFAFTIVDDTDFSSVSNTETVYEFLRECGIPTTKTVWPLCPLGSGLTGGGTLEDPHYRGWIERLQRSGVEIALHGVADGSSPRERVAAGLERFRSIVGHDPSIHTNHVAQGEGIYWGPARLDGPLRWFYQRYRTRRGIRPYDGALPASPNFWGDLCHTRIKYVRNFVFNNINTLKADPLMPYHDPRRQYVRYWFSASNGATPEQFCRLISEANQDRLAAEGGACIVYTHLGQGFHPLTAEFRRLLHRLSRMPGWFVPATPLLDLIGAQREWRTVAESRALRRMQWQWAWERSTSTAGKLLASHAPWRDGPAAPAPKFTRGVSGAGLPAGARQGRP